MLRLLFVVPVLAVAGCQTRDADLLGLACQRAGQKLGLARGPATGTITGTLRGSLGETSLSARVESRLRWERSLADKPIEVVTTGPGTVTLRGTLDDQGLRTRAVELAKTTLGVEKVIDELGGAKKEEE